VTSGSGAAAVSAALALMRLCGGGGVA